MGRMSGYTGKRITWEMFMNSTENLTPEKYDLSSSLEVPAVAKPGITPFV